MWIVITNAESVLFDEIRQDTVAHIGVVLQCGTIWLTLETVRTKPVERSTGKSVRLQRATIVLLGEKGIAFLKCHVLRLAQH